MILTLFRAARRGRGIFGVPGLLVFIGGMSPLFALNPQKTITQYGHDVWLRRNGLPSNAVNVVVQKQDGYLWLGTAAGLYRFDGVRFDWISIHPDDSTDRESVTSMACGSDGSLWVGTAFGNLCRLKEGEIRRYDEADGIRSRNMNAMHESARGELWLATSFGLYRSRDDRFSSVPIDPMYLTSLAEDHEGRIWVGTQKGIRILAGDRVGENPAIAIGPTDQPVTSLYYDRDGTLWAGTINGLLCWRNRAGKLYTTSDGLSDNHITSICEDGDGNLWVGTNSGGLNRLTGGKWTSFTAADGLSNNHVLSIFEDREGSLWAATLDGLNRFKDVDVTPYTTREGLSSDFISSVMEMPGGALCFLSSENGTMTRVKDGVFTRFAFPVGPSYVARDGSLWVGQNGSLVNVRNNQVRRYGKDTGLPQKWISAITEDGESLILYFTDIGVRRFVDGKVQPYLLANGKPYASTEFVSCFHVDAAENLWIGTANGLVRINTSGVKHYGSADGMADQWVNSMYDDRGGSLWLTSPYGGLTRLRNDKFTSFNTKNGLFTNEIYCVLVDHRGDVWLSSPRGIGRLRRSDLDDYERNGTGTVHARVFTVADGMKTDECFGGWQPAGWRGSDGRLWFATNKGAVMIDPSALSHNELPPPVLIDQVTSDNGPASMEPSLKYPPGTERLEFHYTALSFLEPGRVLFKYRLEGIDRDWVSAGTRRVAYYTNLSPGEYRFRVLACNNDGVWNETGASVGVYLSPYFYQTRWFAGLALSLLAGLIIATFRLRVRALKAHEVQLEALVQLRTNELQEQRSFLRRIIDLNPSFIFAKDRDGRFTLANRALAWAYGATVDQLLGKKDSDLLPRTEETEKFRQDDLQVMESKSEKFIPEEQFTGKNGERRWMQVTKIPITGEDGSVQQLLGVANDITGRKEAEEQLRASLKEKEVLLKEVHHRVKNNLQVVSSLLNLQAGQMKDATARSALAECRNRVRSMALIHESLYQAQNLAKINFAEYLRTVTIELIRSFGTPGVNPSFILEPLFLSIDTAIPCGLIVNELVTNALRHAFHGREQGTVTVALRRAGETSIELSVSDDGIGFPADVDIRALNSMGITLVLSLSEQIGGTCTLLREPGTTFRVAFPMKGV